MWDGGKQWLAVYGLASETTDYLRTEQYGNCNACSVKATLRSFSSERHSNLYNKLN